MAEEEKQIRQDIENGDLWYPLFWCLYYQQYCVSYTSQRSYSLLDQAGKR
jgi:hypothetical protein